MINDDNLRLIISRCIRNDLNAQELLYRNFYGFAMSICLRYSNNSFEAREIINDGFFKVFRNLDKIDLNQPFKPWLARVMRNTSIDFYRSELRHIKSVDLELLDETFEFPSIENKLNYDALISLIQKLPPAYRMVFNLYAIDGFTHPEIAEKLSISQGSSKSNLFKARKKLQELLQKQTQNFNSANPMEDGDFRFLSIIK